MKLFGSDMILFGSDLILFGSNFKFQELSFMVVAALTNFGVKNQVPQVFFKIGSQDLISFHRFGYDMNLFGSDLFSDLIVVRRLHTSSINLPKAVSSLEKVGEV